MYKPTSGRLDRLRSHTVLAASMFALLLSGSLPALAQQEDTLDSLPETGCVYGDCENGRGTFIEDTDMGRTTYRGTFRNGQYDGFGRLSYDDLGEVYKGYFRAGRRHGRGTFWDRENNVYIGQWRNDRRNGHGTQAFRVSDWREDAYTEQGLEANTENYTGSFRNDVFFGEGTYRWLDGTRYVGSWAANKKHGEGHFDYGNGQIAPRRYEYDERVVEFGF